MSQRHGPSDEKHVGEILGCPALGNGVRDPGPQSPTPGSPCMMSRVSPAYQLGQERLRTRLSVITRWEKDHVVAGAERHELQTPKPHDGAEAKRAKTIRHLGFPEGKGVTCRRPLPGTPTVGVWTRDLGT